MSADDPVSGAQKLRKEAEATFAKDKDPSKEAFHELRVPQIEIEMQNEELRRTQNDLDILRARYFDLYDLAPVGYVTLSEGGFIREANLTLASLLRVMRGALIQEPFSRLVLREDQDRFFLLRKNALTAPAVGTIAAGHVDKILPCDLRLLRRDGTHFWAELVAVRSDVEGEATLRITVTDITARKQAENRLRISAARFRRIMESDLMGMLFWDARGDITEANDAFLRMIGYSRQDLVEGKLSWRDMTPPEYRPLDEAALLTLSDTGTARPFEKEYFRQDGSRVAILIGAASFREEPGRGVAFVLDISERKTAEKALRESEVQLRHAVKLEAVGRLAGGVAHDFNNMLGVILGQTELALDQQGLTDATRARLAEIQDAAKRSAALTRQLLGFARKQAISPGALETNTVVSGTITLLRRLIGENVSIEWQPAEAWPIWMDPTQLQQILTNLCLNARDAINGVGKVTIATGNHLIDVHDCANRSDATPGEYVRLSVADTGSGIDPATLERVFEPFFTTKGVGAGTGLGLAMVHGVVSQNRGFITVSSTVGQGTTFDIFLPRYVGVEKPAKPTTAVTTAPRGHETILLVEDEPAVLRVASRLLVALGYVVVGASGPAEAIALAGKHPSPIDLLLTDVMMPGMSGHQMADEIQVFSPTTKRLFMSGYAVDIITQDGVLDPGMHFLEKPFTRDGLAAAVRAALDA